MMSLRLYEIYTPGLYSSHTVNAPWVVGADAPFLYVTAIVSLRTVRDQVYLGLLYVHGACLYFPLCAQIHFNIWLDL